MASGALLEGQGSGTAPTGLTPGTGVLTALGDATNSTGGLATVTAATSFMPSITFATPGDLVVNYTTETGSYTKVGPDVCFVESLAFTPTYTTASGNLQISLPTAAPTATGFAYAPSNLSGFTWPGSTDSQLSIILNGTADFLIRGFKSGGATSVATTTNFPSGTAATIQFGGCYF